MSDIVRRNLMLITPGTQRVKLIQVGFDHFEKVLTPFEFSQGE